MATIEQVERVLKNMEKAHPIDFFKKIDETQVGIGAVLRLLNESGEIITAGKISNVLNISTARVAVLLKKMVAKGLITKEQDVSDGRVTIVKLTESGEKIASKMREDIYAKTAHIIDTVGEERLREFIAISKEIRATIKELPDFD